MAKLSTSVLAVSLMMVVMVTVTATTRPPAERQRRSDDGGPLQAVVENLSNQVNILTAKMAAVETKTGTLDKMAAFHAYSSASEIQTVPHGTLILDHVYINVGQAYDPATGVFTAPVSGLYDFQANIMGRHNVGHVTAGIFINGSRYALALSDNRQGKNYQQTTMRVVLHVKAGSQVSLKNVDATAYDYYGGQYTTFSGLLVKADQ